MITASVNLIPEGPVERIVALGRLAEELGYARCWVYDEGLATRDVYVTLSALAATTSRIELGPGITNPYTRHPATTAATIATLDELSGGRAFLGIGAGGSLTLDPLGIDRSRPLAAVRDVMSACRDLLDGGTVTLESPSFRLAGARIGYPVRPGIEIWLAGRGPRMLALGGELADGVMLDFVHIATLGEQLSRIRLAGEAAGRRPRIAYSTMIVTDDRSMATAKAHMTYRLVDSPPAVRAAIGLGDAEVARIRGAMAGGLEAAAEYVHEEWVLPFVISGSSTSECRNSLNALFDQFDLDEFLLPVLDLESAESSLRYAAAMLSLS